jgi:hypothetical protein
MEELRTPAQVIDALGGNAAVADIVSTPDKPVTPKAVWNWRKWETLPPKTYVAMFRALCAINKTASPSLWGMAGIEREHVA